VSGCQNVFCNLNLYKKHPAQKAQLTLCVYVQIGTTKGTGGDVLILEEAAYCDEGFFYETVAPILSVGSASLVAISTLTSEINFYTRLIKMRDPATGRPLFVTRSIELCCEKCKEDGKSHECVHMLHLVPSWQSQERHRKLHVMMQVALLFFCALPRCTRHTHATGKTHFPSPTPTASLQSVTHARTGSPSAPSGCTPAR